MKPRVLASPMDAGGDRCVDILLTDDGYGWVECRRDVEDSHGWRLLHPPRAGFACRADAEADARASVGWLAQTHPD